jgi:uncharacterized Fe-S center protein
MQNVFFSKQLNIEKVLDKIFFDDIKGQRVGIKVHFGERGCKTYVPSKYSKRVCEYVSERGGVPVLIETNVLYRGERTRAETHQKLAREHGFDFAEIDILDGDPKKSESPYPVGLKHFTEAYVGGHLKNYDKIIVVSHFKGHILSGFGGAIKNVGMGMASRKGKLRIHASRSPVINPIKCDKCGLCVKKCQGQSITLGFIPKIDKRKCQSCSGCIAICPKGAVMTPWWSSSFRTVVERMVEYAYAVTKQHEMIYLNFAINLTRNCDCLSRPQKIISEDVGLFGSKDILAVDKASLDAVNADRKVYRSGEKIKYAGKVRIGDSGYRIVDVDFN